jgi:hypothetical protein
VPDLFVQPAQVRELGGRDGERLGCLVLHAYRDLIEPGLFKPVIEDLIGDD